MLAREVQKHLKGGTMKYKTKDLFIGAYLYAMGQKFLGLEDDGTGIFWFTFKDSVKCEKLVLQYWNKESEVNAKDYADAIRSFKDIVFSK